MWQPMPRKLTAPLRRKIEAKLRHCILFEFNENEIETVHAAGTRIRSSATLLHGGLFHQAKRQFDEVTSLLASTDDAELARRFNGDPRAAAHILQLVCKRRKPVCRKPTPLSRRKPRRAILQQDQAMSASRDAL
jgi:hypothetical protein